MVMIMMTMMVKILFALLPLMFVLQSSVTLAASLNMLIPRVITVNDTLNESESGIYAVAFIGYMATHLLLLFLLFIVICCICTNQGKLKQQLISALYF